MRLSHLGCKPGDGIIDDSGSDRFASFRFQGMLIAVELFSVTPYVMLALGVEDKTVVSRAGLVVHDDIGVFRLPDEVDVSADDVSVVIQMAERLLMMPFDSLSIAFVKGLYQIIPAVCPALACCGL